MEPKSRGNSAEAAGHAVQRLRVRLHACSRPLAEQQGCQDDKGPPKRRTVQLCGGVLTTLGLCGHPIRRSTLSDFIRAIVSTFL